MKIINLSRVGISKQYFFKDFFLSKVCIQGCPQDFPKGCPQCFPQILKNSVSMIPLKAVHRAISSKFLTKHPISVPTSHVVVTLSLYIYLFLFLVIAISAIFMLFLFQNYHFKFPLVASKVSPKSSNKAVSIIPPKALHKALSSKFITKQPISLPTSHLVFSFSLYIFGIVCS